MEIHKPKPWHNWREFMKELGTIALGVCIALAAEQAVEWWHWRGQIGEARSLIATEMSLNMRLTISRMRTAACTERRLDELAGIVDAAAKSGNISPVGDFAMPPRGYWRNGSWESVVASQAATHFPRQQLADFTSAYKMVATLEDRSNQEVVAWDSLYTLVGPGRRLDSASEARLREALSHARTVNRLMAIMAVQLMNRVNALGLPYSPDDLERIAESRRSGLIEPVGNLGTGGAAGAICAPLGKVPPLYGQGSFNGITPLLDNAEKSIPDFSKALH